MASNFPAALPNAKTDYDSNDVISSADPNALAEDINAIALKVGIDSSADTNSLDYKVNNVVVPVKATGAEVNTGTDDAKFATPKALADSNVAFIADIPVKATGAESNVGTNDAKFLTPLAYDTARNTVTSYSPAGAGTTTLDLSLGDVFRVTMPGATQTLAISNESVGQIFTLEIVNTTSQGALTWFSTIKWARGGSAPSLTGVNGEIDVFTFRVTSADNYIGYTDDTYLVESDILDEDDMASDSATQVASQQSIKAYVDAVDTFPTSTIQVIMDGGGVVLDTGVSLDLEIPYDCTITGAKLIADQSGSVVIDIWKDTYANTPPTDADSITASAPPTLSGAQKSNDTTLTGWTKTLSEGDTLRFNVDSVTTITRVTLSLKVTKT